MNETMWEGSKMMLPYSVVEQIQVGRKK